MWNVNPGVMAIVSATAAILSMTLNAMNWSNTPVAVANTPNNAIANTITLSATGITVPVDMIARVTGANILSANRTMNVIVNSAVANSMSVGNNVTFTINNGDSIAFEFINSNNTAYNTWSGSTQVLNITDANTVIDTFTFESNVEGNDRSVTPAPAWANITDTQESPTNATATTNTDTIDGITGSVSLLITLTQAMSSTRTLAIIVDGATVTTENTGTTVEFIVAPGATVSFKFTNTDNSDQIWSGTATVTNLSDGGATLDTFTYSLHVNVTVGVGVVTL